MPDIVAVSGGAPVEFDPWKRHRVVEKKIRRDDFWERMGDAYISMLAAGIAVAYGAGIAHAFSASLRVGAEGGVVGEGIGVVPGESAASALVLLGLLAGLSLMSRLGPVAVDSAQGFWWLGLPVDRTSFLSRLLRQRLVATCLYGLLLWLPIGYGSVLGGLSQGSPAGVLLGALSLGLLFALLSLLAALVQTRGWAPQFHTAVNALYLAVAVAYGADVLLRLTGTGSMEGVWAVLPSAIPAMVQEGAWWIPVVLLAAVAAASAAIRGQLQRIPSRDLVFKGAASAHAGAALALLDDKSLSAAIDQAGERDTRRSAARRERMRKRGGDAYSRMLPASLVRGPFSALIRADALVLLRAPKVRRGLLVGWGIPAAGIFAVQGGQPLVLGTLVVVGSCVAAKAASAAAAQACDVPALESIIPLGRGAMRQTHAAVAAMLMVPWGIGLAALLAWAVSLEVTSLPVFLGLGALAGASLAAGAVRLAYRPPLDWGSVMLLATLGNATGPMIQHFTYGYDVMVVSMIALVAGLFLDPLPPTLAVVAAVVAAICWGVGTSVAVNSKVHGVDGKAV